MSPVGVVPLVSLSGDKVVPLMFPARTGVTVVWSICSKFWPGCANNNWFPEPCASNVESNCHRFKSLSVNPSLIVATLIEKPLPVPPMVAAVALKVLPTAYPLPAAVNVTVVTVAPATTIVAFAPEPEPPVKVTLVYVPLVYSVPPTKVLSVKTKPVKVNWLTPEPMPRLSMLTTSRPLLYPLKTELTPSTELT